MSRAEIEYFWGYIFLTHSSSSDTNFYYLLRQVYQKNRLNKTVFINTLCMNVFRNKN